jgi:uncharacterized membrane protein required for colicin V production
MIAIIIILILAYGFYTGHRRGLAYQLVFSFGYTISYLIAATKYQELGSKLELWIPFPSATEETKMIFFSQKQALEMDKAFYAAVAFVLIYFICYLIVRLIGIFAHKLMYISVFGKSNHIVGGVFGLLAVYIGIFLILYLLSMVPMNSLQNVLASDPLARAIIERTPFFTNDVHQMWIIDMIH